MLVLTRKVNEDVVVVVDGREISFKIAKVHGNRVWVGIEADKDIPVHRREIWEQIMEAAKE